MKLSSPPWSWKYFCLKKIEALHCIQEYFRLTWKLFWGESRKLDEQNIATAFLGDESLNLEELDTYWHAKVSHAAIFRGLSHCAPACVQEVAGNSSHLHITPEAPSR